MVQAFSPRALSHAGLRLHFAAKARHYPVHAHDCVSIPPALTAPAEAEGTPAIFRELHGDRHAPPATVHAPLIAPSGRHGPKCGIAGTPTLPSESPAHSADIVVEPLQNYMGIPISNGLLLHHLTSPQPMSISRHRALNYSSSALIVYSPADISQLTCRMFGLQHTWQSSTYCWRVPAEESMLVSFHSPHPAH